MFELDTRVHPGRSCCDSWQAYFFSTPDFIFRTFCEKHAQLFKLQERTQKHLEYSERETVTAILQDRVPEAVTTSIVLSGAQVPPPAPHWLSTLGCSLFFWMSAGLPIGLFKIRLFWDWSNFRGRLLVGDVVSDSFYPFPKFLYQLALPNCKLGHKQAARVKCLALKVDHRLYF
jgi:hypothetical protein